MATPLTVTRFNSALKVLFPEKKLQTFGMEDQPFRAYIPKQTDFYGRNAEIPIQYSPGGMGNSHTFEDAQAAKGSSLYTHFVITRKRDYKIISIDAEALEASENDKGAYLEAKKLEIEAALTHINQQFAADLQGDGSGRIGTIATGGIAANVITVGDADITHFEPGMRIQTAATPFTAVRPGTVGWMYVGIVNYDANTITIDPTQGGDSVAAYGAAAADRIYPKGNFGLSVSGTEAWIPTDRSNLATPFNNVTRSVFPSRLAGVFFDASSYGLLEGFERAYARARKENCHPETVWVNFNRFTDLSLELGAKAMREPAKFGEFAYDSITMSFGGKKVRFMADQNLPDTTALCTTRDTWGFKSLKSAPRILTRDMGSDMLIEPAADGYEIRIGWRGEVFCRRPGGNMRITLPV